ncbi:hypothetical protein P171DRAFT_58013 [Karstenula rhodostoma CBS 690.94]|uniref:Uncharacterized protein n=1 Tax=Karstenula rhodostoma CBS 690.94 TaxID=1392251 RepID=A0A9P4PG07_9PLEO|nr:hypothetical protein P171DRAFT_58013 [Karstenula rhodostoma CBS 690.94]
MFGGSARKKPSKETIGRTPRRHCSENMLEGNARKCSAETLGWKERTKLAEPKLGIYARKKCSVSMLGNAREERAEETLERKERKESVESKSGRNARKKRSGGKSGAKQRNLCSEGRGGRHDVKRKIAIITHTDSIRSSALLLIPFPHPRCLSDKST